MLEKGLMDRSGHHISWQPAGRVTLCERGGPLFPDIEPVPGLFRLDFEFGQAGLAVITGEHLADRNYRRQLKKQVSW
jgi:hypothetical protein